MRHYFLPCPKRISALAAAKMPVAATACTRLSLHFCLSVGCALLCVSHRLPASAACGCVSSASHQASSQASPQTPAVRLIEGDILVPMSLNVTGSQLFHASAAQTSIFWPNGTLPYSLSADFTAAEADFIASSLRELQLSVGSAVTFPRVVSGQAIDYVSVSSGQGCNSYVGRQGGAQAMSLQRPACLQRHIVQHEFLHALGYWHEQSRSDRAKFVDIWWGYIDATKCSNFGIFWTAPSADYPSYDTQSIMHYESFAFSCDGRSATITSKVSGLIPYSTKLTSSDVLRIHYYYGPGDNTTVSTQPAGSIVASGWSLWLALTAIVCCRMFEN